MGFLALLLFLGFLALSLVWSLICASLTALFIRWKKRGSFLFLASLNLGLALFPFHQAVLTWHEPNPSDNGVGGRLDMSIWLPVVSVFLIHWVIVLWFERYRFWLSTFLVTILVSGICYAYYRYPNVSWAILLMAVMIALQVDLVWKAKQTKA